MARNVSGNATSPVWSFTTTPFAGYRISTFAGTGQRGFSGDGGPAAEAQLSQPTDLAFDRQGNLYLTDGDRIRRITPGGTISTIAGTGTPTNDGDGGPATVAGLSSPAGLAVDGLGAVYVSTENRVRKIAASGDHRDHRGRGCGRIQRRWGTAANALLSHPGALAVDTSGNLYLVDSGNCVRKVSAGIISTIAGSCGAPSYGNVGEGGPATAPVFGFLQGLAVDASGVVYVTDFNEQRVRQIANGIVTTLVGSGRKYTADSIPFPLDSPGIGENSKGAEARRCPMAPEAYSSPIQPRCSFRGTSIEPRLDGCRWSRETQRGGPQTHSMARPPLAG